MNYRIYTYIMSQLATRKFVVIELGDNQFLFRIEAHEGEWKFSLKLSSLYQNKCSNQIQECLF